MLRSVLGCRESRRNLIGCRATRYVAGCGDCGRGEANDFRSKLAANSAKLVKREVPKIAPAFLAQADKAAHDGVRFAKRNAPLGEGVGVVRRGGEVSTGGLVHSLELRNRGGDHIGHDAGARYDGIYGIEERLFVFLQVLVVRKGESLEHGEQSNEIAGYSPRFATD